MKSACFKLIPSKISQVFNNSSLKEDWEYNFAKFNIQFKIQFRSIFFMENHGLIQ